MWCNIYKVQKSKKKKYSQWYLLIFYYCTTWIIDDLLGLSFRGLSTNRVYFDRDVLN